MNVNSNGKLFGSIYAPKAPVNVNSVVHGSVIAPNFRLQGGATINELLRHGRPVLLDLQANPVLESVAREQVELVFLSGERVRHRAVARIQVRAGDDHVQPLVVGAA